MKKTTAQANPARGRPRPIAATSRRSGEVVQYTVRNVPVKADGALRRRAVELNVSLNEVLRQAILREAGMGTGAPRVYDDLDHLTGVWVKDPVFDAIIAEQDRVDEDLWK